ncbi:MAG: 4a-hydroxytetrahydrobiopterin dehydratase [Rhodospirillales bacterium]
MVNELTGKGCTPCRGGLPPLGADEARRYLAETPDWRLDAAATRIERHVRFADFGQALAFVNQVGALAEAEGHHPDICFGWGYCTLVLYTHKINGLHENDFILAAKIDALLSGG